MAYPSNWPSAKYNFEQNPITEDGYELGKKLFFDPILSRGNQISCEGCHQQFAAFSHLDHDLSHGVDDLLGIRNAPPLFNLAWHESFFWDGGVNHIELQPLAPIENPLEMDESMPNIIAKLSNHAEYPLLFQKAFGTTEITTSRVMKALAQFQGLLISDNSKYDQVMSGKATFTEREKLGYKLFKTNCASCHQEPLFSTFSFSNNGLEITALPNGFVDSGRGRILTWDESSYFQFKIPSLRNLSYSFPYMHNGNIKTLPQVLNHYTNIDTNALYLDPILKKKIVLSDVDKENLLLFLKTLDDPHFTKNPSFKK